MKMNLVMVSKMTIMNKKLTQKLQKRAKTKKMLRKKRVLIPK